MEWPSATKPGWVSHIKGAEILVVSLRGVNFGFWSHLGCSGQFAIIFSREGLAKGCTRSNIKNMYLSVLKCYLLGVKNNLGHAQITPLRS